MVSRLILISSVFLCAVYSYGQKKQKSPEIDSASYYIALGDFEKAIHFLDQEINKNPSSELFISQGNGH